MLIADAELVRWRALCESALPGPWECEIELGAASPQQMTDCIIVQSVDAHIAFCFSDTPNTPKFIATARAAMPRLLDEVERLRADILECANALHAYDHADKMTDERNVPHERAERYITVKKRLQEAAKAIRGGTTPRQSP